VSEDSNQISSDLLEMYRPMIRRIVASRLAAVPSHLGNSRGQDLEDVISECSLRVVIALNKLTSTSSLSSIADLASYIAKTTHNACSEYISNSSYNWQNLKRRVRYVLELHPEFFHDRTSQLCGLSSWDVSTGFERSVDLTDLLNNPTIFRKHQRAKQRSSEEEVVQLLKDIFNYSKQPIELKDLVVIFANNLGPNGIGVLLEHNVTSDSLNIASRSPNVEDQKLDYCSARHLIHLISTLSRHHRLVLLLNLKTDTGYDVIRELVEFGEISDKDLSHLLDMEPNEAFELLNRLPMDDNGIAELLGVSRQQVINYRSTARSMLNRQLANLKSPVKQ
jgi:DNA-directed RNA polymerase specialized sigma24 family protein